jgi:hypothetical protein
MKWLRTLVDSLDYLEDSEELKEIKIKIIKKERQFLE